MIVWGGSGTSDYENTGGRYNPGTDSWTATSMTNAPTPLIATTPNESTYIDSTGDTGRARSTYQVCEAGTSTCSNEATVTFRH